MQNINLKLQKKIVCVVMLFAVLICSANIASAETSAENVKQQESKTESSADEYLYGIHLTAVGGNPQMAIQLCAELAKKYKDYTHWTNVKKAETYINNPIYFDQDINTLYLQALNLLQEEITYEKTAKNKKYLYDSAPMYMLLGNAYYGLKDYKNAVEAYNKAGDPSKDEELFDFDFDFYYKIGCSKALIGDYKGALNDFNKISLDEFDTRYERYIVRKEIIQNLLSGQKDIYFPESESTAQAMQGVFIMATASNDYKKALELTDYATKVLPNSSKGLELKGVLYAEQKKYAQAEKFFDEAIKKNTKELNVYYSRSEMYYNRKMYEKALEDINKNLQIKNSQGYILRAKIKYAMKDYAGALSDFESARKINISSVYDIEDLCIDYPKLKILIKK